MGDMNVVIANITLTVIWALVGAICLAVVSPVAIKVFDLMTKGVNEEEELRKGNVAVGLVLMGVIIGISIIVAAAIMS
jgi:uncharacterized membrane protein YjfL (UPF0719 family)